MVEINGDIIRTNWTGEAHFKQFGRERERERKKEREKERKEKERKKKKKERMKKLFSNWNDCLVVQ